MKTYQFKELEIKGEGSWFKRVFTSPHAKKTIIYTLIGAIGGFMMFYFSQDAATRVLWSTLATEKVLMGMALGLFITNSPCARGRC